MAGVQMVKTREMMTMLVTTMDHIKAVTNSKAAILNLSMHMKVVMARTMTTTTSQVMLTDKAQAIKCQMMSRQK